MSFGRAVPTVRVDPTQAPRTPPLSALKWHRSGSRSVVAVCAIRATAQEPPHRVECVNLQIEVVTDQVGLAQSQLLADGKFSGPPLFPELSVGRVGDLLADGQRGGLSTYAADVTSCASRWSNTKAHRVCRIMVPMPCP